MIDTNKSLLDNLRNRYIVGYPELLVTLSNEFDEFQKLTIDEAQKLQEERRNETRSYNSKEKNFGQRNYRNTFDNKVENLF